MASFKVGDRVKRIKTGPSKELCGLRLGVCGCVVAAPWGPYVAVCWDEPIPFDCVGTDRYVCVVYAWTLAPLTPPAEDTWAADKVRQVTKPQHVEPAHDFVRAIDDINARHGLPRNFTA